MTTRRILLRITSISLLMALLAVGGLLAQPTPPPNIADHNIITTTFTFDDGADPSVWFSGTYAIAPQAEGGYGMAITLDDAPVTLNRPLLDGETLAVTIRRGVGRAGVRLVGETAAYTVWIETSGIAVLERDGAEQGRVPVAGDAQRVTLTYASGTLTAAVGAYAFPPISDGTAFVSLRAEFVVQGGNGQGSTFDDVTVPLPSGLVMSGIVPTLVPTPFTTMVPLPPVDAMSADAASGSLPQLLTSSEQTDVRYRLVNAGDEAALNQAITDANNGLVDVIYLNADLSIYDSANLDVAQRTYYLDATLNIAHELTIYGNNAILRPQNVATPVYPLLRTFPDGHLIASHLHLTQTTVSVYNSYAAGIANYGRLTLRDSSLTQLTVVAGGAGLFNGGIAVLERVTLDGNHADGGAGVQNDYGGQLTVTCSRFVNNTGFYGVAILNGQAVNNASLITISYSLFQNNRASGNSLSDIYNIIAPNTISASSNFWASGPPAVTGPNIVTSNPLTADPTIPDANGTWTHPECEPQFPVYVPVGPTVDILESSDVLLALMPSPPIEDLEFARGLISDAGQNFSQLNDLRWPRNTYGACDPGYSQGTPDQVFIDNRRRCVAYAYATFYAFFEVFTGYPPTMWDFLSATYTGELGTWMLVAQSEIPLEALARNFFGEPIGACQYVPTDSVYTCTYEQFLDWAKGIEFWYRHVANVDNDQVRVRLNNIHGIGISDFDRLTRTELPLSALELRPLIPRGGMFEYDIFIRSGSENITTGLLPNLPVWRSGQGPDVPSTWGNRVLSLGETNYQATSEEFLPLIVHVFSTNPRQTRYSAPPNTQNILPDGTTASCTYLAIIVTTDGRTSVSNCQL